MRFESAAGVLRGRRILLVEDEYVIAEEMAGFLREARAVVLGPAPSPAAGLALLAATRPDGAVLDVNLGNVPVWPLVDALAAAGVPLMLATGYDSGVIPPAYAHLPRCQKPVAPRDLLLTLAERIGEGTGGA